MVQILDQNTPNTLLGQAIGRGISQGAENLEQNYFRPAFQNQREYSVNRSRLQEALKSIKNLPKNATPFQATASLIEATAGIPGAERYVGPLLQTLLPQLAAQNSQDVDLTGGGKKPQERPEGRGKAFLEEESPTQRQFLPGFGQQGQQESRFFPTNLPGTNEPGNFPQAEAGPIKEKLLNPRELEAEGKRIGAAMRASGNAAYTDLDGYNQAKQINDDKRLYNQSIDTDLQARKAAQDAYGAKAEEKLLNLFPEATDEQKAFFRKKGEEAAKKDISEADIDRHLAVEAKNFKNMISNVRSSIPAQRTYNMPKQAFLGTDRAFEKRRADLRFKLEPLLKEGLYDTARNLLAQVGYYPEETESIIGDLGEYASKSVAQMTPIETTSDIKKGAKGFAKNIHAGILPAAGSAVGAAFRMGGNEYTDDQRQDVKNVMEDILTNEPNANLILLRKAMEAKGVDWQLYKDTLNDLLLEKTFEPNNDQFNHLHDLDEPPLNLLENILHKIGFIGR